VKSFELSVPGVPAGLSEKNMKTKPTIRKKSPHTNNGTMRKQYDFSKGLRGKHAALYAAGTWRQRISMFQTGFHNFPRQALRNFGCFCDRASLGHQAWNIRARGNIATFFERLYMKSDCRFVH
jgi:hypothetical protein